ncbi:hypothetical protein [Streptomyces venetus]|uniref:hypothetical protein n=1 Tax=Streptomyces venetus TaxID=1701086 RepID=UPI003C30D1E2
MHDEQAGHTPDSALTELRSRLADGLAGVRLNQTQLATQARLGRTTVSEALSSNKPVPSAETVAALVRVLKLPVGELLEMRRTAAHEPGTATAGGLGRPIGQWGPHALEVHPAGSAQDGSGSPGQRLLPGYVPREHDRILAEAVRDAATGRSRMLVLVGSSSTGKTRACWEAVQPLAEQGWRLAPLRPHPRQGRPRGPAPGRPAHGRMAGRGPALPRRSGGWEEIAAAVHGLLTSPQRGPVLVLGTLWADYVKQYTALPAPGGPDPHSRVRELLAGRTVSVPDAFDARALAAATALAEHGDRLLAEPSPAPARTDASRRTSPEAPRSWSATAPPARPPKHYCRRRWTPAASVSACICRRPSSPMPPPTN